MDCPIERFDAVDHDPARGGPSIAHARLRGANWFSVGPNPLVFWLEYDRERIENELDLARSAHLNSLRVWLSHEAFLVRGERTLADLDHLLGAACARGVVLLLVLTDFAFGWNGKGAVERWSGTPGVFLMADPTRHGAYLRFLDAVLERVAAFPPYLVMFDVANEPLSNPWNEADGVTTVPSLSDDGRAAVVTFLVAVFERITTAMPRHERTVGQSVQGIIGRPGFLDRFPLTFQSFHGGYRSAKELRELAETASRVSPLPVVLTETCASPALLPHAVRVAREFRVGFMFWGLMKGFNEWNTWTGLFHPDGAVTSKDGVAALIGGPADRFVERPHDDSDFPALVFDEQIDLAFRRLVASLPVTRDNVDEVRSLPWELLFWGTFADDRATHLELIELHAGIEDASAAGDVEEAHRRVAAFLELAARAPRPRRPGGGPGPIPRSV